MTEQPTTRQLLDSVLSIGEKLDALTKLVQANHKEVKGELEAVRHVLDHEVAGQDQVTEHHHRLLALEKSR